MRNTVVLLHRGAPGFSLGESLIISYAKLNAAEGDDVIYEGSCHCGKMRYEVDAEMQEAVSCNCSLCSRRGYLLWFLPAEKVRLQAPLEDMSYYTFNRHHIKHYFCPACGSGVFGMGTDKQGHTMVAVNVRCLPGVDLGTLKTKPFDGRSL